MRKIRVAIIVPGIRQLGPVKVIQALTDSLSVNEFLEIKVFHLDKAIDVNLLIKVPVERLVPGRFKFDDFDIIHTNGIRPDLIAYIFRWKIKYHISTIHNLVFEDLKFTYGKIISWVFGNIWLHILRGADKLVCISKTMLEYYSVWFIKEQLTVIYNGIIESENSIIPDTDIPLVIDAFHSKRLSVIGTAGTLTRRKGIDQVLRLIRKNKEFALLILGKGKEMASLQRLADKWQITDRCLFFGFRNNAVNYFRFFDLAIFPSRSEGFCLSLVEAVQNRVPVVCSDIKVFKELFNSSEVTFFKLEDQQSLENAMATSISSGQAKVNLAFQRYKSDYTSVMMAENYYNLYNSA